MNSEKLGRIVAAALLAISVGLLVHFGAYGRAAALAMYLLLPKS
jgi:hypothetical protein